MKLIIPSSLNLIKKTKEYADAYLIGLKDYSVNMGIYLTIAEIEKLIQELDNKKLFVAVNKNMRNEDLEFLKENLDKLENMVDGILYYDAAILSLAKDKSKLILSQEHATTNYFTINHYAKRGIKGVYLSSEITIDEIEEICNNTNLDTFVNVFGYVPIFLSKRFLVTNYKKFFNKIDNSKLYYMEKENKWFPLLETSDGTIVYNSEILNAYEDYDKLNSLADYLVFNSTLIDDETFIEVLKAYDLKLGKDKVDMLLNYHTSDLFMHKKTIYKVIK